MKGLRAMEALVANGVIAVLVAVAAVPGMAEPTQSEPTTLSIAASALEMEMSDDGRSIAWATDAPIIPGDPTSSNWYLTDLQSDSHEVAVIDQTGQPVNPLGPIYPGIADNEMLVGDLEPYIWDRESQASELVARVPGVPDYLLTAAPPTVGYSPKGDFVAVDIAPQAYGIHVLDRAVGTFTEVLGEGFFLPTESGGRVLSNDGVHLVAVGSSSSIDDPQVVRVEVGSGTAEVVSVTADGVPAQNGGSRAAMSADGGQIAYSSSSTDLLPEGANSQHFQVYLWAESQTEPVLISKSSSGVPGNGDSYVTDITPDGRWITFISAADDLVSDDSNGSVDAFRYDTLSDEIELMSVSALGTQGSGDVYTAQISSDGQRVAFLGSGTGWVPGVSSGSALYIRDLTGELGPGSFVDDDESVFESDIEWLASSSITKGCNPPTNDRFCPDDPVTRGQMAAFLNRALDLEPGPDTFTDTSDSVFSSDIGALAAAGITRGCNPPANTEFCPGDVVTREQMAAFLVRALGYSDNGGGDLFVDDDTSVFEADIDRLGTAGVTRGCNPPENDRFCPDDPVTRGQMAAFLRRALEG